MRYYLGLDGGGTKTAAVILDSEGKELGRGQGGSGNVATNTLPALQSSLQSAVKSALRSARLKPRTHFAAVCAGVAGYSAEASRNVFRELMQNEIAADTYLLEPDYVIAYWGAAHGEPGVVIIAGTGAVAYGRNAEGRTHKEDGLGYLLGDRGSGYDMGMHALRHAVERLQEGRRDALTEAILNHADAETLNALIQWLYSDARPARIAALAPVVGKLAQAGDAAAGFLAVTMANQLRSSVRLTQHRLGLSLDTPVYPLGGLWQLGDWFLSEFARLPEPKPVVESPLVREMLAQSPYARGHLNLTGPRSDPAYGAALLAWNTKV